MQQLGRDGEGNEAGLILRTLIDRRQHAPDCVPQQVQDRRAAETAFREIAAPRGVGVQLMPAGIVEVPGQEGPGGLARAGVGRKRTVNVAVLLPRRIDSR